MRKILMGVAGVLALAAGSDLVQAAPLVTGPITKTPTGPITGPGTINIAKPDIIITKVVLSAAPNVLGPGQIGKISVDLADNCHRGLDYSMFVQVTIYTAKGGKALTVMGNTGYIAPSGTGHVELDVSNEHRPMTSYVYVEADAAKKIPEVVESNNYWSVNPNQSPFPQAAGYCNAK